MIVTTERLSDATAVSDRLSELVKRCGSGEEDALSEFYALTRTQIFGLIVTLTPSAEKAYDAMAMTYVNVWQRSGDLELSGRAVLPWLGSLAVEATRRHRSVHV